MSKSLDDLDILTKCHSLFWILTTAIQICCDCIDRVELSDCLLRYESIYECSRDCKCNQEGEDHGPTLDISGKFWKYS